MSAGTLLAVIAGQETEGFIEVRWPVRGGMGQSFHDLSSKYALHACQREIEHLKGRGDVFVGAAPRTRREGVKDAVRRAWCLWVDCDTPDSVAALAEFAHPPTLTIHSGSDDVLPNTHAWWALSAPIPASSVELGNRRLQSVLGSDQRCTNADRIMRPPGSLNWKHKPPAAVELVTHAPLSYGLADLVVDIPDPRPPKPVQTRRPVQHDDDLASVPVEVYYQRLSGREPLQGNSQCPFHGDGNEKNPSLRLYPKTDTWYCFACQLGGGVYEFGATLWNVGTRGEDFKRLRQRLCEELGVTS